MPGDLEDLFKPPYICRRNGIGWCVSYNNKKECLHTCEYSIKMDINKMYDERKREKKDE